MTMAMARQRAAATVRVNLLPAVRLEKAKLEELLRAAGFAAAMLFLALLGISAGHWMKSRRLAGELARKEAKLQELQKIVVQVQDLEKLEDAVKERLAVIKSLAQGRSLYPVFLSDFVKSVPVGVRVLNLRSTGGGSKPGPISVQTTALAHANSDIALWLQHMEEVRKFSAFKLGAVTATSRGSVPLYNFTLGFDYTPAF